MGARDRNIFISYGHNIFDEQIKEFRNLLLDKLKDESFSIFLDVDYLKEGDWEKKINDHIICSKWMIFFVSKRSVSTDGYCLNELCRACEKGVRIIPILLDNSDVPLSINRLQRYSLFDKSGKITGETIDYVASEIAEVFLGKKEIGFAEEDLYLRRILKPIDFQHDISVHYEGFVGREKIFKQIEGWLYDEEDDNLFVIKAFPGFGKTAFSANCCWRFHDEIAAIHFCKYNNSDKADTKRIITSLAFSIAQKVPDYKSAIQKIQDFDDILSPNSQKNADRIFELLFVEAMSDIYLCEPVLIVIDALDEAIWQGQLNNELCNILRIHKKLLPSWLKILVTCRDDNNMLNALQYISTPYCITKEVNEIDLRTYFEVQLKKIYNTDASEDIINSLLTKSDGSFIYAREVVKYIKKYKTEINKLEFLPIGLYDLYFQSFNRMFSQNTSNKYEDYVPLLELICVTPEELTLNFVKDYLGWNERETSERIDTVSSLIPVRNDKLEFVHKTLKEWLTSHEHSGRYFISEADAYEKLRTFAENAYKSKNKYKTFCLKHYGMILIALGDCVSDDAMCQLLDDLQDLLNDKDFQIERIDRFTLDTGLKMGMKELSFVYRREPTRMAQIFGSETFKFIFSKYRRLLYNSGLFFHLKKIGFSEFLSVSDANWGLEGEVGKIFYHYITEDFAATLSGIDDIFINFKDEFDNMEDLLAEIYNVKGLALRKVVKFDDALIAFDQAITHGKNSNYNFEISLAHLLKSKINVRMASSEECIRDGLDAIKYLNLAINDPNNASDRLSNILFLAEDYRVLCDNMIWLKKFKEAREYIDKSEEIYQKYATTDRYYIRAQYTRLLLNVINGEKDLSDRINELFEMVGDSRYDRGQVNIIKGLYNLLNGLDLTEAAEAAMAAYKVYGQINCLLEKEEARCLYNIINSSIGTETRLPEYSENKFINIWIEYFENYIKNLLHGGLESA